MDSKIYRYFTELEQQRNFSRAAQELFLSPQGLNSAIRRLEGEVGLPLIEVRNGSVELTDFGRIFSRYAHEMDRSHVAMREELDALAASKANNIRIGCATGILGYFGEDELLAFNDACGPGHIVVVEEVPDRLCESNLVEGKYDFALITNPIGSPELTRLNLCKDYQFIWVNNGHPLADKHELTLADIAGEAVMTMDRAYKNTEVFERLCAQEDIDISVSYTGEMMRIYEFARTGKGLGLTCRNHGENIESSAVVCLPFKCLNWGYSLCYQKSRLLSQADGAFIDFMLGKRRVFD